MEIKNGIIAFLFVMLILTLTGSFYEKQRIRAEVKEDFLKMCVDETYKNYTVEDCESAVNSYWQEKKWD